MQKYRANLILNPNRMLKNLKKILKRDHSDYFSGSI